MDSGRYRYDMQVTDGRNITYMDAHLYVRVNVLEFLPTRKREISIYFYGLTTENLYLFQPKFRHEKPYFEIDNLKKFIIS